MKTLQKDGRTLKPEDIYMDLSKLSEEEIDKITKILEDAEELFPSYSKDYMHTNATLYFDCKKGWLVTRLLQISNRKEITYPDFLKLFGESELTELPEKWFIRGGVELKKYFEEIGQRYDYLTKDILDKRDRYYLGLLNNWCVSPFEPKPDHIEITVADYKRLTQESEKTCADLESNAHEKAETCKKNLQVEEKSNEMLEGYKAILEENGSFVFPKAPEGEFPDLSGFEGVEMEVSKYPHTDFIETDIVARVCNGVIDSNGRYWVFYQPIQKTKPTVDNLWKKLVEAGADLSEFEKPV